MGSEKLEEALTNEAKAPNIGPSLCPLRVATEHPFQLLKVF